MANVSGLARRLDNAIRKQKEKKAKNTPTATPVLFYDPYGKREATWINGPMPDDYHGAVFYMPYNDRDDDDGTQPLYVESDQDNR